MIVSQTASRKFHLLFNDTLSYATIATCQQNLFAISQRVMQVEVICGRYDFRVIFGAAQSID
jgi:hypothetical protein